MQFSRFARKGFFAAAILGGVFALALPASATQPGNNGGGNGGCGVGQQTNGCGGSGGAGGDGGNGGAGGAGGSSSANAGAAAAALAGALSGSNAQTGPVTNTNANNANGGLGLGVGMGGAGGTASSNGTNLGINGQQQGIDRSGNSSNSNSLGQGQSSENRNANTAAQGQGQGQSSTNSVNGGAQTNGQSSRNSQNASTRSGSDNTIRVDASDRSGGDVYESKTTVWAPVIHGAAAAPLAAANLVVVPGVCGPRMDVVRTPVIGKRFGVWGGQSDVEQGFTEQLVPSATPFVRNGEYLLGHQITEYTAVVGTSSAGSFSLGGYGKNGDGAQGGGAASGQLQQIVSKVSLRDCIMATPKVEATVATVPAVQPLPVIRTTRE